MKVVKYTLMVFQRCEWGRAVLHADGRRLVIVNWGEIVILVPHLMEISVYDSYVHHIPFPLYYPSWTLCASIKSIPLPLLMSIMERSCNCSLRLFILNSLILNRLLEISISQRRYEAVNLQNNKTSEQRLEIKDCLRGLAQTKRTQGKPHKESCHCRYSITYNQFNLNLQMIEEAKQNSASANRRQRMAGAACGKLEDKAGIFNIPGDLNIDCLERLLGKYDGSLHLTRAEIKKDLKGLKGHTHNQQTVSLSLDSTEPIQFNS